MTVYFDDGTTEFELMTDFLFDCVEVTVYFDVGLVDLIAVLVDVMIRVTFSDCHQI